MWQRLKSWLFSLLNIQPVSLSAIETTFLGQIGEVTKAACQVMARRGKKPVSAFINFKVIEGLFTFSENGMQEIQVKTNKDGEAMVEVQFDEKGGGVIQAFLANEPSEMVFFDGKSEGITHRLIIEAPCEVSVDGPFEVLVYAYDHRNEPVSQADLELSMLLDSDHAEYAEVVEVKKGIYRGELSSQVAGIWEISGVDYTGRSIAQRNICIHPSAPDRIEILNVENPRLELPRDEMIVPIAVFDKYDNFLDAQFPVVRANGKVIDPVKKVIGDPALYTLRHDSHGSVDLDISIPGSDLVLSEQITYPAAALLQDKTITVGSEFTMPLYIFPGVDKEVKEGRLEITFDPALTSFKAMNRSETDDDLQIEHNLNGNKLEVSFFSETGLSGEAYKNGLYIADTTWQCEGAGKTLFSITGGMSPVFKQCDQFMIQKQGPEPKDLCIQILYMNPIGQGIPVGVEKSAELFELVLNGNWRECCPTINVNVKTMNLQTDSRIRIYRAIGRENKMVIKSKSDYLKFKKAVSSSWEVDSECLSVFLINIDFRIKGGRVLGLSHVGKGPAVVDPDHTGSRSLVMAHELAHTLGLRHTKPNQANNIVGRPMGFNMNEDQCEKIRDHAIFQ